MANTINPANIPTTVDTVEKLCIFANSLYLASFGSSVVQYQAETGDSGNIVPAIVGLVTSNDPEGPYLQFVCTVPTANYFTNVGNTWDSAGEVLSLAQIPPGYLNP